ncbi:HAD family phosphatase [Microbacterium sp. 3J1]|uniref:HAD family hydrolase n=1 Tax=Microbacterium sp. 3J1 TaxID=861269 RepID=UPI000ADC3304|nr:HAD family hydrolase [Microbacterium sp. 3J1]
MADLLTSWRDTATRRAIESFVDSVTSGSAAVPVPERVAVFDNDGTLWTEKPMPTQLAYVTEQWRARLAEDRSLASRQPYLAVASGDLSWIGAAVDKHYAGDDTDLHILIGAIVEVTKDLSVDAYASSVGEFYRTAQHPTLTRPYAQTVYRPMVELLRYLEAHDFTCYIVSAGERDFMRPMAEDYYGIPPERVIGSAYGLTYDETSAEVRYGTSLEFFDDGPEKPVRIWSRIGRRPIFAAGNANGDMPMLDFALGAATGFGLIVHHDDHTGRGDTPYDKGAEKALAESGERGYTVVSVADDWSSVFPDATV